MLCGLCLSLSSRLGYQTDCRSITVLVFASPLLYSGAPNCTRGVAGRLPGHGKSELLSDRSSRPQNHPTLSVPRSKVRVGVPSPWQVALPSRLAWQKSRLRCRVGARLRPKGVGLVGGAREQKAPRLEARGPYGDFRKGPLKQVTPSQVLPVRRGDRFGPKYKVTEEAVWADEAAPLFLAELTKPTMTTHHLTSLQRQRDPALLEAGAQQNLRSRSAKAAPRRRNTGVWVLRAKARGTGQAGYGVQTEAHTQSQSPPAHEGWKALERCFPTFFICVPL